MKILHSHWSTPRMVYVFQPVFLLLIFVSGYGQTRQNIFFKEVRLKVDTTTFSTIENTINVGETPHLYFEYEEVKAVCEVEIYPNGSMPFADLQLLPSGDFEVVDSLMNINDDHYRFKVRFKQLTTSDFLQFTFSVQPKSWQEPFIYELHLLPVTKTSAFLKPKDNKLFIGEERTFKVETNRPNNIKYSNQWTRGENIDYKFSNRQGELLIHLLPNQPGMQQLSVPLLLKKPMLVAKDSIVYHLSPLEYHFDVKESKLVFLNTNKKEVSLKNDEVEGIEIEMEYHPSVELKKPTAWRSRRKREECSLPKSLRVVFWLMGGYCAGCGPIISTANRRTTSTLKTAMWPNLSPTSVLPRQPIWKACPWFLKRVMKVRAIRFTPVKASPLS